MAYKFGTCSNKTLHQPLYDIWTLNCHAYAALVSLKLALHEEANNEKNMDVIVDYFRVLAINVHS